MKIDYNKVQHVAFCQKCGFPKKLHIYHLKRYYATGDTRGFYCNNNQCGSLNEIPKYILDYIKEL